MQLCLAQHVLCDLGKYGLSMGGPGWVDLHARTGCLVRNDSACSERAVRDSLFGAPTCLPAEALSSLNCVPVIMWSIVTCRSTLFYKHVCPCKLP